MSEWAAAARSAELRGKTERDRQDWGVRSGEENFLSAVKEKWMKTFQSFLQLQQSLLPLLFRAPPLSGGRHCHRLAKNTQRHTPSRDPGGGGSSSSGTVGKLEEDPSCGLLGPHSAPSECAKSQRGQSRSAEVTFQRRHQEREPEGRGEEEKPGATGGSRRRSLEGQGGGGDRTLQVDLQNQTALNKQGQGLLISAPVLWKVLHHN